MSDKNIRCETVNKLIRVIAGCGRKFFCNNGRISYFEIDLRGRIWFIDSYNEARIYTHFTRGTWRGFSEGGTLRDVVVRLRDYISSGKQAGKIFGPYPDWYSDGDPWGYGSDMKVVYDYAVNAGIVQGENYGNKISG